jgi:hypothetical protein
VTDLTTVERQKPGRPRKFGQGRVNATVRFTRERYSDLKAAADVAGRSISEEVEARIEKLTVLEAEYSAFLRLEEVTRKLSGITSEQLDKALARISELEEAQALNEAMIERAVLKALAKTRLTIGRDDDATEKLT